MTPTPPVRLGSRGSALAVTQTNIVATLLGDAVPIERVLIRTSGDQGRRELLGAFVREVQDALLEGRIDVGIHSLKDMPTGEVPGLTIAAIPVREDPRDVLLTAAGPFRELPAGARVGTGSARRQAQLAAARPDLQYLPLVGNVDTRIGKLRDGQYDAIVLALAGINRLGYVPEPGLYLDLLDEQTILPAPGQGALALECRSSDLQTVALLEKLDDPASRNAVIAERAVLSALGGGCSTPIAAYGRSDGLELRLTGLVASTDGRRVIHASSSGQDPISLGNEIAAALRAQGADEILNGGRHAGIS